MPPTALADSIWVLGSRTVKRTAQDSGLSRNELWDLMDDGTLAWQPHGGRGTRLIAWASVVAYLDRGHKRHLAGTGARTEAT